MMKIQLKSKKIISALTLASLAILFTHMRCSEKENAVRAVPENPGLEEQALEEPGQNPPINIGCTNPNANNFDPTAQSMGECEFLCPDGVTVTSSHPYSTTNSACVNNPAPNNPPRLVIPVAQNVNEGQTLSLQLEGVDPDQDDVLHYSAVSLPEGATISDQGVLNWTPTYSQGQLNKSNLPAKEYTATVKVSDGEDHATASFHIYVSNVNRDPSFVQIANQQVNENETLQFSIGANDQDLPDDQLSITCDSADTCSKIEFTPNNTNQSASISYSPGYNDSGSFELVFKVTDYKGKTDTETVTITVGNSPRPPQLVFEKDSWAMNEKEQIAFPVSAIDPDNDNVKITVVSATAVGYNLSGSDAYKATSPTNETARNFTWEPGYDSAVNRQATAYEIKFRAEEETSYALFDEETITITVSDTNRPPVLAAIGNKSVEYNAVLSFSISATDPDGDPITYSAMDNHADTELLASGQAAFNSPQFTFDPDSQHFGKNYQLKFMATDSYGASDNEEIQISVGMAPANLNETINLSSNTTYTNSYDTMHIGLFADHSGSMEPANQRIFSALTNEGMQDLFEGINLKITLFSIIDDNYTTGTNPWNFRRRRYNYPDATYYYANQARPPMASFTLSSTATAQERQQFFSSLAVNLNSTYATSSSLTEETPVCSFLNMANYDQGYIANPASNFSIQNNEAFMILSLVGGASSESQYTCRKGRTAGTTTQVTQPARYQYRTDKVYVRFNGLVNNEQVGNPYEYRILPINSYNDWQTHGSELPSTYNQYIGCSYASNGIKNMIENIVDDYQLTLTGTPNPTQGTFPIGSCEIYRTYWTSSLMPIPAGAGSTACTNGIGGQTFQEYIISNKSSNHNLNTPNYCYYVAEYTTNQVTGRVNEYFQQNNGSSNSLEGALADHLYNRFSADLDRVSYLGIHRKDSSVPCQQAEQGIYSSVQGLENVKTKLTNVGIDASTVDICKPSYVEDIQGSIQQTIENVLNKTYVLNIPAGYQVGTVTVQYANQSYNTELSSSSYVLTQVDDGNGNMVDKITINDFEIPAGAEDPGPASVYIEYTTAI